MTVSLTATGGITYSWSGGSNPDSATNTFANGNSYSVTVVDANGCSASASQAITFYPAANAGITGLSSACNSVVLRASGGNAYAWNGGSSTGSATDTFTTNGTYTVTVTNGYGCSATASTPVTVYPAAIAGITGAASACSSVELTATGGTSYAWNGGNSTNTPVNDFATGGTYTVTVTTNNGCSATASQLVTIYPAVIPYIVGPPFGCGSISLLAVGGTTYAWSGVNGGSSPDSAANTFDITGVYTVTVSNIYGCSATASTLLNISPPLLTGIAGTASACDSVTLTAITGSGYLWSGGNSPNTASNTFTTSGIYTLTVSNSYGCSASASQQVTIYPSVTAGITGTSTACSSVSLTATGGSAYAWSGGNSPDSATNIFTASGIYAVTVSNSNGCSATASSQPVTVYPAVTAAITGATTACNSVSLAASGGNTYAWNGGNSDSTSTNTFTTSGTYTVTVSNSNGCSATASQLLTVYPGVNLGYTGAAAACQEAVLTATGGSSYQWSGGSSLNSATNTFLISGFYTVTGTNSYGCSANTTIPVTVFGVPSVTITGTTTACGSVTLTAGTGLTYAWSGGSSPTSATNTFTTSGTYHVTVTDGGACSATASKAVTVNAIPVAAITGSTTGCGTVSLKATGGGTYAWSGGNTPTTATNSFTTSGTYTVTVTSTAGCTATASQVVTVNPVATVAITGTTPGCGSVTLTATPATGLTYAWSGGSSPNSATNIFTASGTYHVTVSNSSACTATASKAITVNAIPTVTITGSTTACTTVSLKATGGGTYAWSGGNTPTTAANSFTTSGTYTLTVTSTNGCVATVAEIVTVNTVPVAAITGNVATCGSLTLTATGGGTYQWSAGSSTNTAANTVSSNGTYKVTVTNAYGCSASASVSANVDAHPATPGAISGSATECTLQTSASYSITPVSGATSYTWTITDGAVFVGSATGNTVTVNFAAAHVANATLKVLANNTCGSSPATSLTIAVSKNCAGKYESDPETDSTTSTSNVVLDQHLKAYPNPTSGQLKVEFSAQLSEEYTFRVYDMLGNLVSTESYQAEEGNNSKSFDLSHLGKGIYFIRVSSASMESKTLRIVLQ